MSDEQLNKKIDVEVPRRTLKDAVAQGLEEKGEGKDKWLWWVCLEYFIFYRTISCMKKTRILTTDTGTIQHVADIFFPLNRTDDVVKQTKT